MFSRVEKNWTTSLFFFFGSFSPIQRIQWNTNCIFSAVSTKVSKTLRDSPKIHPRFFIQNAASNWGWHTWNAASIQISIFISVRKLNLYCIWLYSGFWQITLGTADTLYSRTGACVHVWKKKKKRRVLLAMYQPVAQGTSKWEWEELWIVRPSKFLASRTAVGKRGPLAWFSTETRKLCSRNPPNTH